MSLERARLQWARTDAIDTKLPLAAADWNVAEG
jgi:hypothetical protein